MTTAPVNLALTEEAGPGVIYAHTDRETFTRVDQGAPSDPRERAVCRALLVHALALIDADNEPAELADPSPTRGRRFKITDDHLMSVAKTYRDALALGEPPTRAVANQYDVAHSTAAKWVGHARRKGAMPATTGGRTP